MTERRYHWTVIVILGAMLCTIVLSVVLRRESPMQQYVDEVHKSQASLTDAQQQLAAIQQQQQKLLERVVTLQGQFVESMEIEVFLLSRPQEERPKFAMPEGLKRRFPGIEPD